MYDSTSIHDHINDVGKQLFTQRGYSNRWHPHRLHYCSTLDGLPIKLATAGDRCWRWTTHRASETPVTFQAQHWMALHVSEFLFVCCSACAPSNYRGCKHLACFAVTESLGSTRSQHVDYCYPIEDDDFYSRCGANLLSWNQIF